MSVFKATTLSTLPAIIEPLSDSAKFWKNHLQPATVYKELSGINSIDISLANEVLTTSSTRISLYDSSHLEVKRTFTSPNHTQLYCGTFRHDTSKIFASGSGDGIVRVWDVKKSKPIRLLGSSEASKSKRHSAAVHRVNFTGVNKLFSCGDDKCIRLWDIAEDNVISYIGSAHAHDDYIRASCFIESLTSIVSGSYDHTVKVWDAREPENCTFQYNHGAPVESVAHRDLLIISAGGTSIKIFDVVAGKVMRTIDKAHHKTITGVHNHGSYLLTASVDSHLKVYDVNFNLATSFSYVPSQLLSCSYNGHILAVGANDGFLSVNKVVEKRNQRKQMLTFSDDASDEFFFDSVPVKKKKLSLELGTAVVVNTRIKRPILAKHDELLRKFRHSAALTRVLRNHLTEPEIIVSLLQELIRRGALKTALAGRTDRQLRKVVYFLVHNLSDPRFTRILLDVSLALVDVYTDLINRSSDIKTMFRIISKKINEEIDRLRKMSEITGQLQILINAQIK